MKVPGQHIATRGLLRLLLMALSGMSWVEGLAAEIPQARKWVASWTTPISGVYDEGKPGVDFALPEGKASNQTFRMIIKPDLWGDTVRIRFSNVYGDRAMSLTAAAVGLQESAAHLIPETLARITFDGRSAVSIPAGVQRFSDPVHLFFVNRASQPWLRGRRLAISFTIGGQSGLLSAHGAPVYSYIAKPNSGDHTRDEQDTAFPYTTRSLILVNELDVMAGAATTVVCALGDSITDGGVTPNGYDGWADDLSQRLHKAYGDRVSVVNMGISGNTVVTEPQGSNFNQPAVRRLDRDVLAISGLTVVVWLEGINDLGWGQNKPEAVIEGYKQVVSRLHAHGIKVVGATVTPSLWPEPNYDRLKPDEPGVLVQYGTAQTNTYRQQLNAFILTSGIYDSVADMARAVQDPVTGALYKDEHVGDYLHPNRAGHQAMAAAVDLSVLAPQGH